MTFKSVFIREIWEDVPLILCVINKVYLFPIWLAPWVFFASLFIFDNPSNELFAWLLFVGINLYPIILKNVVSISLKLYEKYKSLLIALIPNMVLVLALLVLVILGGGS